MRTGLAKSLNPISDVISAMKDNGDQINLSGVDAELLYLDWEHASQRALECHNWSNRRLLRWRIEVLEQLHDRCKPQSRRQLGVWAWISAHARLCAEEIDPFNDHTPSGYTKSPARGGRPYSVPCVANVADTSILPDMFRCITHILQPLAFSIDTNGRARSSLLRILEKSIPGRCSVRDLASVAAKQLRDDPVSKLAIARIFVVSFSGGYGHSRCRAKWHTMRHIAAHWGSKAWICSKHFETWLRGTNHSNMKTQQTLLLTVLREFLYFVMLDCPTLRHHTQKHGILQHFLDACAHMDTIRQAMNDNVQNGHGLLFNINKVIDENASMKTRSITKPRLSFANSSELEKRQFAFWAYTTSLRMIRHAAAKISTPVVDTSNSKSIPAKSIDQKAIEMALDRPQQSSSPGTPWRDTPPIWTILHRCIASWKTRGIDKAGPIDEILNYITEASATSAFVKFHYESALRTIIDLVNTMPNVHGYLRDLYNAIDTTIHMETTHCFTLPISAVAQQRTSAIALGSPCQLILCRTCYRIRSMTKTRTPLRCHYKSHLRAKFLLSRSGHICCGGIHANKGKVTTIATNKSMCIPTHPLFTVGLFGVGIQLRHCCISLCITCLRPHIIEWNGYGDDLLRCESCLRKAATVVTQQKCCMCGTLHRHHCIQTKKGTTTSASTRNQIFVYHKQDTCINSAAGGCLVDTYVCDRCAQQIRGRRTWGRQNSLAAAFIIL